MSNSAYSASTGFVAASQSIEHTLRALGDSLLPAVGDHSAEGRFNAIYAAVGLVLTHVLVYNVTARLAHSYGVSRLSEATRRTIVYGYAGFLILSALIRDHYIFNAMRFDEGVLDNVVGNIIYGITGNMDAATTATSFFIAAAPSVATTLQIFGLFLNAWTMWTLGLIGTYNGDSFGFLQSSIISSGPFAYFSDPQYVGTALYFGGSAIGAHSMSGIVVSLWMYSIFSGSAYLLEQPHMEALYGKQNESSTVKSVEEEETPAATTKTTMSTKTVKPSLTMAEKRIRGPMMAVAKTASMAVGGMRD